MSTVLNSTSPAILPPPHSQTGVVGWMRLNLFSSWYNSVLSVAAVTVLVLSLWFGLGWVLLDADWSVISTLGGRIVIGQYNIEAACPGQNCFWRPQAS